MRAASSVPGLRRAAGNGCGDEGEQTGEVDATAAEDIAQPAHRDRQHADHEYVAGDRPLGKAEARVQIAADGGKGDIDDEHVDHQHAEAEAETRRKYRALLQAEVSLVEGQIQEAQKKVEMGVMSPNGPEMVGLKLTLLALQRKLVVFDGGGPPSTR